MALFDNGAWELTCELQEQVNALIAKVAKLEAETYITADKPSWSDVTWGYAPDNVVPINQVVNQIKQHLGIMITKVPEYTQPQHITIKKVDEQ
jgi:hypothetical protein